MSLIPLPEVVYDCRARDGTWCAEKSADYPKGCPNFPRCPQECMDFKEIERRFGPRNWFAVIEEFDIAGWEASQRKKHEISETNCIASLTVTRYDTSREKQPIKKWSRKQLRNPRHWQKAVMASLKAKAQSHMNCIMGDLILQIPEAHGVDVVRTMAKVGVTFEWGLQAKMIRKVMLVGKKRAVP
jgi:hypothetical protein